MSSYRWDDNGNLLRADQTSPLPRPGDRFFDVANGRWALLIEVLPPEKAGGAPFRALYDGCDRFDSFIAKAMAADIGEVISCV